MFYVAYVAGALSARATDPVALVFCAVLFLAGCYRARWWVPFLGTATFTVLTVVIVYPWWLETGMPYTFTRLVLTVFFSSLPLIYASYGIGRLCARIAARPERVPS